MKRLVLTGLVIAFALTAMPGICNAVAFKMKNDSQYHLRARCYDRGQWRGWVQFSQGGWGDFATSVTRAEHSIEIQIWNGNGWQRLYYGNHGSRMFTRIVQVYSNYNGEIYLLWWDEPPGCRDSPPHPERGGSTCLKTSGWYWDTAFKYSKKIGMAYLIGQ
jgi:hypothetical protein